VKTVSDEAALAEARTLFPPQDIARPEDLLPACDDCFGMVTAWARVNAPDLLL
jgi:hypothetical protein